jgi:hypothetical protein
MHLRFLAARGFEIPDDIRERVQSCLDTTQLEDWGAWAATAASLEDIFGGV